MPFTLDADRPVDDALRHATRKQRRRIEAGLAGRETVHETRKALKRLRALTDLVAPLIGQRRARKLDRDLRDISRSLAHTRDRDVLRAMWAQVGAELALAPSIIETGDAALATWTPPRPRTPRRSPADLMSRVEQRFEGRLLRHFTYADLLDGTLRTYKRAHRGLADAQAAETSDAYHEWRKEVQRHWRHTTLLLSLWPDEMSARAELARALSHTIGEEHDRALLAQWLTHKDLPSAVKAEAPRIRAHLGRHCDALRRRADREGRRLFAERPKAFRRRLSIYASTTDTTPSTTVVPLRPRTDVPDAA